MWDILAALIHLGQATVLAEIIPGAAITRKQGNLHHEPVLYQTWFRLQIKQKQSSKSSCANVVSLNDSMQGGLCGNRSSRGHRAGLRGSSSNMHDEVPDVKASPIYPVPWPLRKARR